MKTTVVNLRSAEYRDADPGTTVYIGRSNRGMHWGNPFSHQTGTLAAIVVKTREIAVMTFGVWLADEIHQDVEPERRKWIVENLRSLRGKKLGCYCAPKACHGDVLAHMADALPE